ncbi:aminoglycoside phosphotransferase family protein [Jeongeupia chitinilytica]|uniref:Aminoglycoside phosphotransferase n=1 Tax=Jeongeupia chitinilytica TaxID=1041641 RepID=A0ABQ3H2B9_9NEIS|nr:phosphotransferase [Jeongeupia chitinilytica]GHD66776.1 aminoglycoside phosphotransferase [Jeongeupia chitinilytica]
MNVSDSVSTWLATTTGTPPVSLSSGGSDASVRHYWRAVWPERSLIVMQADPALFDARPFLARQAELAAAGIRVPTVLAQDADAGLVLLEDLGESLLAPQLSDESRARDWYLRAIDVLVAMQVCMASESLPVFDTAFMQREMEIGREWYLERHLGATLDGEALASWQRSCALISAFNASQSTGFMHRDYHSRNLMIKDDELVVIDFQDAVRGPLGYDLVSLLRDAYVDWEEAFVLDLAIRYWEKARAAGLPVQADFGDFYKAFEWLGLQRHLKVLGLFARLHHRDGKSRYLADIPRVLNYVNKVCERYVELGSLKRLLLKLHGDSIDVGFTF